MILSNTVATSVTLNGATSTVNTPADEQAPPGFSPGSNGQSWIGLPSPTMALVTPAPGGSSGTCTLDWSLGGYFNWVPYNGTTTLAFANAMIGQMILVKTTAEGSLSLTWPTTLTWYTGSSGTAPTLTSKPAIIAFVCTGVGTYDAWLVAQQS